MHAKSLLGSARVIDSRLEDLLSASRLADAPESWTHAAVIRATLTDVAEQLRASVPLPAASDDPDANDERFVRLLDVVADDPTPERAAESVVAESVAGGEFDSPADDAESDQPATDGEFDPIERFHEDGRVEVRGQALVVPLGDDPAGRNWWAVLEYLRESVADLAVKASRVHSRMVVTGAGGLLVDAWDSVAQRLDVLGDVLDGMTANGRYAGRQATAADGPTEFVAWTADQFGTDG